MLNVKTTKSLEEKVTGIEKILKKYYTENYHTVQAMSEVFESKKGRIHLG